MKIFLYSFIACLLVVFLFIQCNSSPTQQNVTQVFESQWKDSITIDAFTEYVHAMQNLDQNHIKITPAGQALLKQEMLINDKYAIPKYPPSRFEAWLYCDGNILNSPDSTGSNVLFYDTVYSQNSVINKAGYYFITHKYYMSIMESCYLMYVPDSGFYFNYLFGNTGGKFYSFPYKGTIKIYYE
jgi:hypothetical protein